MKIISGLLILTFPILIEALLYHHLLYKRVLPFDSSEAENFKVIETYPKPIPSPTVCAGYAAANVRNLDRSTNNTHYVNAFKYTKEDQTCKIGTIPYWHLKDIPTRTAINEPGIMVHQGCYLKNWNKTKMFEDFPPEMELYFPGDDNIFYKGNENTKINPKWPSYFTLGMGGSFFTPDSRKTFLSMENNELSYNYHQFDIGSYIAVYDFTLMAWFHGRGVSSGTKPIISLHYPNNWYIDTISLMVGCPGYTKKVCAYYYDSNYPASAFIGGSNIEVDFDRWTHLAMTFDDSHNLAYFYIDGVQAGPAVSMYANSLYYLYEIHLSAHGYNTNYRCHCYMADVVLLKKMLTQEEIRQEFEKYLTGDDCPFGLP